MTEEAAVAGYTDLLAGIDRWLGASEDRSGMRSAQGLPTVSEGFMQLLIAGPDRIDDSTLDQLQRRWIEWLSVQPESVVSSRDWLLEVQRRTWYCARSMGASEILELLSGSTMERVARHADGSTLHWFRITRADALRTSGKLAEAVETLDEELHALGDIDGERRARCLGFAVKLEIDLGRLDRAQRHAMDLVALAVSQPADDEVKTQRWLAVVRLAAAAGRDALVLELVTAMDAALADAARTSRSARHARQLGRGYAALAEAALARESGNFAAARAHIEALLDRHTHSDDALRVGLELESARLALETGRGEPQDLIELLDRIEQLASPLSRARGAATVHSLARRSHAARARAKAGGLLHDAAEDYQATWLSLSESLTGIGFLGFADRRLVVSELVENALADSASADDALAALLRFDACKSTVRALMPKRATGGRSTALATPTSLRDAVEEANAQLVVLMLAAETTHAFVIERGRPTRHERLGSRMAVEADLASYATWLHRAPKSRVTGDTTEYDHGVAIGDRILGLLDREDSDERPLWVVGWDPEPDVPLEGLPTSDGAPLGLRFPIVHAASSTEFAWSQWDRGRIDPSAAQRVPQSAGPEVVLLGLEGDDKRGRIGLSNSELMRIRRASGQRFRLLRGSLATEERLVAELRAGTDIVALWTHGEFHALADWPAQLLLAAPTASTNDGEVDAGDLAEVLGDITLEEAPGTVFLATCGANKGHRRLGDALASRTAGVLLGNGVRSVISARGDLHRDATAVFLEAFLRRRIAEGDPIETAVLEARRAVAAEERFGDPHYWGPLSLHGR